MEIRILSFACRRFRFGYAMRPPLFIPCSKIDSLGERGSVEWAPRKIRPHLNNPECYCSIPLMMRMNSVVRSATRLISSTGGSVRSDRVVSS